MARGWVRPDSVPFADTIDDLIAGRIFYPPELDETGAVTDTDVVTMTRADGTAHTETCGDLVSMTGRPLFGRPLATTGEWTEWGTFLDLCGAPARLYCFGVDRTVPVSPAPVMGRRAFVTDGPFRPGAGRDDADALCAGEATAAGLSGTFLALLPTTTESAAARFPDGPTWVRLDGVALAETPRAFFDERLVAPLNRTPTGRYRSDGAWSGAATPRDVARPSDSCSNWMDGSAASADLGVGRVAQAGPEFFGYGGTTCDMDQPVYCLER